MNGSSWQAENSQVTTIKAKQCVSKCVLWTFLTAKFVELKCAAGKMGTIQGITEEQVNEDVLRNTCVRGSALGPRDDDTANPAPFLPRRSICGENKKQ